MEAADPPIEESREPESDSSSDRRDSPPRAYRGRRKIAAARLATRTWGANGPGRGTKGSIVGLKRGGCVAASPPSALVDWSGARAAARRLLERPGSGGVARACARRPRIKS